MSYIQSVQCSGNCSGLPISNIFDKFNDKDGLERIKHLSIPNGLYVAKTENPCKVDFVQAEVIDDDMFDFFDKVVMHNKKNFTMKENFVKKNRSRRKKK